MKKRETAYLRWGLQGDAVGAVAMRGEGRDTGVAAARWRERGTARGRCP
jgi:hypothetical protein